MQRLKCSVGTECSYRKRYLSFLEYLVHDKVIINHLIRIRMPQGEFRGQNEIEILYLLLHPLEIPGSVVSLCIQV